MRVSEICVKQIRSNQGVGAHPMPMYKTKLQLAKNGDVICGLAYTKLSSVQMQNYASMLGMFQIRISNLTVTGKITKKLS